MNKKAEFEHISFKQILEDVSHTLTEQEIWAICKECLLSLQKLPSDKIISELLCLCPDTIYFYLDQSQSIGFEDITFEPDAMFRAPEFESIGNSIRTHIYSLGMCLWLAVQYGKMAASPDLRRVLADMTSETPAERPEVRQLLLNCEPRIASLSSDIICNELAAGVRWTDLATNDELTNIDDFLLNEKINGSVRPIISLGSLLDMIEPCHVSAHIPTRVTTSAQSFCSYGIPPEEMQWASLGQLESSGLGVVRCTAECLALLREMVAAAITLNSVEHTPFYEAGLTPEHIVLWEDGQISLMEDAEGFDADMRNSMSAPEVVEHNRFIWDRSLVYNLGVLLCHVLDVDDAQTENPRSDTELGPRTLSEKTWKLVSSTRRYKAEQRPSLEEILHLCDKQEKHQPAFYKDVLSGIFYRCTRSPDECSFVDYETTSITDQAPPSEEVLFSPGSILPVLPPYHNQDSSISLQHSSNNVIPLELLHEIRNFLSRSSLRRCAWPHERSLYEMISLMAAGKTSLWDCTPNTDCSSSHIDYKYEHNSAFKLTGSYHHSTGNLHHPNQVLGSHLTASTSDINLTNRRHSGPSQTLPQAFTSVDTHFRPIILHADNEIRSTLHDTTLEDVGKKLATKLKQIKAQNKRPPSVEALPPAETQFRLVKDADTGLYQLIPQTSTTPSTKSLTTVVLDQTVNNEQNISSVPDCQNSGESSDSDIDNKLSKSVELRLRSEIPVRMEAFSHHHPPQFHDSRQTHNTKNRPNLSNNLHSSHMSNASNHSDNFNLKPESHLSLSNGAEEVQPRTSSAPFDSSALNVNLDRRDTLISNCEPVSDDSGLALASARLSHHSKHVNPIDRLLSRESLCYQKTVATVIRLVQQEFHFEGALSEGVDDLGIAEYITSLLNLSWNTFKSAICERYTEFSWSNVFLQDLYKIVNGNSPPVSSVAVEKISCLSSVDHIPSTSDKSLQSDLSSNQITPITEPTYQTDQSIDSPDDFSPECRVGLCQEHIRPSIVYSAANIKHFYKDNSLLDLGNMSIELLLEKKAEVSGQLNLLWKQRLKTDTLQKRLSASVRSQTKIKSDQKILSSQYNKDLDEIDVKLQRLDSTMSKIEILMCEFDGVTLNRIPILSEAIESNDSSLLSQPTPTFPDIRHHMKFERSLDLLGLKTSTVSILSTCLFSNGALTSSYIHHFFLGYRYFLSARDLLAFLSKALKLLVTLSQNPRDTATLDLPDTSKMLRRLGLLVMVWLEGYYHLDIAHANDLSDSLDNFILNEFCPRLSTCDASLMRDLLMSCKTNDKWPLFVPIPTIDARVKKLRCYEINQMISQRSISFQRILDQENNLLTIKMPSIKINTNNSITKSTNNAITFSITDYTPQTIAQTLTIIIQEYFRSDCLHLVEFLTSNLTNHIDRINLESSRKPPSPLNDWIHFCQSIEHWILSEIISASTSKLQAQVIILFISTAKYCLDMRNFCVMICILKALESPRLTWAPAWNSLSTKWHSLKDQLFQLRTSFQMKEDILSDHQPIPWYPLIPYPEYIQLQVKQLELGSFSNPSGLVKWDKIRSLASFIDQIRLLQQFSFQAFDESSDLFKKRIKHCCSIEIDTLFNCHAGINIGTSVAASNLSRQRSFASRMKQKFQMK